MSSEQQDAVQRVVCRHHSPPFSGVWVVFSIFLTVFFAEHKLRIVLRSSLFIFSLLQSARFLCCV